MTNSLTVADKVFSNKLKLLLQKYELLPFFQLKVEMYLPYFKKEILKSRELTTC